MDIAIYLGMQLAISYVNMTYIWIFPLIIMCTFFLLCCTYEILDWDITMTKINRWDASLSILNMSIIGCVGMFLQWTGRICPADPGMRIDMHILIIGKWLVLFEILFYSMHRILHIPFLYSRIHYTHHKYEHPRPIYCQYNNIIDCCLTTIIPVYSIFLFMRIPINIVIPILILMIRYNAKSHRYDPDSVGNHSIHHKRYKYNFSNSETVDRIFGTFYYQ